MFWRTLKERPDESGTVIIKTNISLCPYVYFKHEDKFYFDPRSKLPLHESPEFLWMDLSDLWKLDEIAEEIEGCCFEIQQNLLPKIPKCKERDRIDEEVSAIDKVMTKLRMQ